MKVLITGANGQLGLCLQDQLKAQDINYLALSSKELDISNIKNVEQQLNTYKPTIVINAAAYTQVDKAESEAEKAHAVNCLGSKNLAIAAKAINAILLHVSTDYVFDGNAEKPYREADNTNPQSVYGLTKLEGEQAIAETMDKYIILRTAWVFSEYGNNFVKTMLRLGKERDALSIVNDQVGCPTYAGDIAKALIKMAKLTQNNNDELWGIYHYCGSTTCSWYDFASIIFDIAYRKGALSSKPQLAGISTSEYPTPAKRPKFSVLDTRKISSIQVETHSLEKLSNIIDKI